MKFCKDCKHYGGNKWYNKYRDLCLHPIHNYIDPVDGKIKIRPTSCDLERGISVAFLGYADCGAEGKLYEPK